MDFKKEFTDLAKKYNLNYYELQENCNLLKHHLL